MKKLMIAAAIVCAAAFANAASCAWSVEWAYANDGDKINTYDSGSAVNYWLVYLDASDDVSGIKFDGKNVTGGTVWDSAKGGTGSFEAMGGGEITGLDSTYNTKYFAMVIYDEANKLYGVSDAVQIAGIVDSPLKNADSVTFSNDALTTGEGYMVATQAVPEPTSGLLLLLGVAGLALRRRRA